MDEVRVPQSVLEIHVIELYWLASRRTQVFVDDQVVGTLKGGGAPTFAVSAGVHRVRVKNWFLTSDILELSFEPGERSALECGIRGYGSIRRNGGPAFWPLMLILLFPVWWTPSATALGLPLLPWTVAAVQGSSQMVFWWSLWRWQISPGSSIRLKPRGTPDQREGAKHPFSRLPRITIRRAMILVAALAVFLAIGSREWRGQRRRECRWEAERHAHKEDFWRSRSRYAFLTSKEKALNARRAEYHARMKQKYLQAASDPWTRVEEEPEPQ